MLSRQRRTALVILPLSLLLALPLTAPASALEGKSSTGELLFYPCTKCHPVGGKPASARPNGFKRHQVRLALHDRLGKGTAACLVCHDSPDRNPGRLKLIDGSLVDIAGNVSLVCYRCHSAKYNEWKAGVHGKRPKCTTSGCHDPHTPGFIGIGPVLPFLGTSIEAQVLPERETFTALPPPAPQPPTHTPGWLIAMAVLEVLLAGGLAAGLVLTRSHR